MAPLYFVPDRDSVLLSDHSRDGSVFFGRGRALPEDIHWRCLCHLCCRYLSEGLEWQEVLGKLGLEDGTGLLGYFYDYMGISPENYRKWCHDRSNKI